ncbi:hypothetical protein [Mycobacterium riyadhense]|uniref:hypothetical protein n=1 Tax=Mycobacterium riyadhense TaxID=486698 RepID=UPI0030B8B246
MAIDSVKIASDASIAANRTEDGLVKAAAQQAAVDMDKARKLAAAAAAEHAAADAPRMPCTGRIVVVMSCLPIWPIPAPGRPYR